MPRVMIGFAILLLGLTASAQTISPRDASQHIGQHATVCGEIAGEHTAANTRGTPTFINLDKPHPSQVFTILIWGESRAAVGHIPESGRVCVTGTITEYRSTPEIVLRDSHSWYVPHLSNDRHYTNSNGQRIHSPAYSSGGTPAGATAQCRDGTYSFSQHHSGTCSHHGGVGGWIY